MFHKIILPGLIIVLSLLLGLACGFGEPAPSPPCPIEGLVIDITSFPKGWHQQGQPLSQAALVRWGVERLGVNFISQKHGVAQQDVYRGRNIEETEEEYFNSITSTAWFRSRENETDWYIPSKLNYESLVADNYRFGCQTHRFSGVENCQLVGQYGVYLIWFHTFMSPIMTYEDLEGILQTIDGKMAQCLGR